MLPPEVDALYDAFKHPRAERPSLPLLPPVEARAYDHEVRGRVLDLIERTPAGELFTAGMVVQHEEQHDETMLPTLQLRQGPPCCWGVGRCRPAAMWGRIAFSWAEARSRLAWTPAGAGDRVPRAGLLPLGLGG
jgi:iron(II)-dependent oxidoreductase